MNEDRELLEAAARAAGLTGYVAEWIGGPYFVVPANPEVPRSEPVTFDWLKDDGDALRLAVKLGMRVDVLLRRMEPFTRVTCRGEFEEEHRDDAAHATRRCIVRAAAHIGATLGGATGGGEG